MPTPDTGSDHVDSWDVTTGFRQNQSECPSCGEMLTAITQEGHYPHTGTCNCGNAFAIQGPDIGIEWVGHPSTRAQPTVIASECPGCGRLVAIQALNDARYPITGSCRGCDTLYIIPTAGLNPLWDNNHAIRVRRQTGYEPPPRMRRALTPAEEARRLEEEAVYRLEAQQRRRPDDERPDPYKDEADQ